MVAVSSRIAMSEPAWIVKWRAREALQNGQPEEAQRLLDQLVAAGNRRAFALRADVVRGYLDRAERALRRDDVEAAWSDLLRVEKLAPGDREVTRLRDTLTRLGLAEIRAALEAGKPVQAVQAIARFRERPAQSPEIASLEEAAQDWVLANEIAERGDFPLARSTIERVRRRVGNRTAGLDRFEQDLVRREDRFRFAWSELQEAASAKNWREMLRMADDVLAVAPRHREAQQSRNRAWQVMQPDTVAIRFEAPATESNISLDSTREHIEEAPVLPKRFFLWIDGVGAWLVCLSPRIAIGQASPEAGPIDVPLYADVSRIHATLTRDEESYILETSRDVLVNGHSVSRAVLQSGDRLSISACPMQFEQPVPGCLSGRLTLGGRRLPMAVDGVLLMADMLVLGPGDKVHVRMPDLPQPLYLFRQKDRLGVRWQGEFSVEGTKHKDRAMLPSQGTVSSEAFTFAIEPISK
jgi:FHA domain